VKAQPPERYVPSTHRARSEFGLSEMVDLKESILRTIHWHKTLTNMHRL